jgi:hypothetical protein
MVAPPLALRRFMEPRAFYLDVQKESSQFDSMKLCPFMETNASTT